MNHSHLPGFATNCEGQTLKSGGYHYTVTAKFRPNRPDDSTPWLPPQGSPLPTKSHPTRRTLAAPTIVSGCLRIPADSVFPKHAAYAFLRPPPTISANDPSACCQGRHFRARRTMFSRRTPSRELQRHPRQTPRYLGARLTPTSLRLKGEKTPSFSIEPG